MAIPVSYRLAAVGVILALTSAWASLSLGTARAHADTTGAATVVLGDSFSANGSIAAAFENVLPNAAPDCTHSPTSWPTQLSQNLGTIGTPDFVDVSCRGASLVSGPGYTLSQQARSADALGAFGPATRTVLIQSGLNDAWGDNQVKLRQTLLQCVLDVIRGCGLEAAQEGRATDYRGITGALYAERIRPVIDYVRYYAPNARIALVGYPEMNSPGSRTWCVNTLGVGAVIQDRADAAIALWDRIDLAQREASAQLGLEFVDARALTSGHGLCTATPWLAGILDPNSDLYGTPVHPSPAGDRVVAAGIASMFGS